MIGHEPTSALYGLDHAVTLAIVLPGNLTLRKEVVRQLCCSLPSASGASSQAMKITRSPKA